MALVRDMRRWCLGHGLQPLAVRFPRFTQDDASWLDEDRDKAPDVSRMVKANGSRLESLAGTIERHNGRSGSCRLVDDLEQWQSELVRGDAGAQPLSRLDAARVCESHAELWRAVQGDLRHGDKRLETAIEEIERLWIWILRRRSSGRGPSVEHAA
jgi:hypothetical protein